MIELRNSSGQLDFTRVTPEVIEQLDEPRQLALLALIKAVDNKTAAVERRNAATQRLYVAVADETIKMQAHSDASSPLPFIAPRAEDFGTKAALDAATREARGNHALRVRGLREAEARKAAVTAYNSSH